MAEPSNAKIKLEKVLPEPVETEPTEPVKKNRPGKEEYKFQTSYRKENICGKFFYCYCNRVVNSIMANKGKLEYHDVEDLKDDDEETKTFVNELQT